MRNVFYSRKLIHALVATSGAATLSWEIIWQVKSSLALGISARGTAITLAVTMGGMGLGALVMGRWFRRRVPERPIRVYAILEFIIGIAGLCLGAFFQAVEKLDSYVYGINPASAPLIHVLGIVAALGVPTLCMGATFPIFGFIAKEFRTQLAVLYGLNTLGAAIGTILAAFLLIPMLGVAHTGWIIAGFNFAVAISAWKLVPNKRPSKSSNAAKSNSSMVYLLEMAGRFSAKWLPFGTASLHISRDAERWIVIVTGFATLMLEVAWFRSITAAFQNTTYAFAIMLASVLIPLGYAGRHVAEIRKIKIPLGSLISWAGILILLATPLIERFDLFLIWNKHISTTAPILGHAAIPAEIPSVSVIYAVMSLLTIVNLFFMSYLVIGAPTLLLGIGFPWILDDQKESHRWGNMYAFNTFAAIVGSLSAAWIFLPTIGFARTAWFCGILVAVSGILITPGRKRRAAWALIGTGALFFAMLLNSGVGATRALGSASFSPDGKPSKLLEFYEGPDSTVSVSQDNDGGRILIIDGSSASAQPGHSHLAGAHYLNWMGALPMLVHPYPKDALVICFGTGQTANAVRKEDPRSLDIVDINPAVFKLAHNFITNESVLDDPRVKKIVMDGRAYLRRTDKLYDVITLEPMPPNLAGVNALYSQEFYELARSKLRSRGVVAQWLPFDTVAPHFAASIARTFQAVFPNAILWIDPVLPVGILLGSVDDDNPLATAWPGFDRTDRTYDLSRDQIRQAVTLNRDQLKTYSSFGEVITDDNQLLAYGRNAQSIYVNHYLNKENQDFLEKIAKERL